MSPFFLILEYEKFLNREFKFVNDNLHLVCVSETWIHVESNPERNCAVDVLLHGKIRVVFHNKMKYRRHGT